MELLLLKNTSMVTITDGSGNCTQKTMHYSVVLRHSSPPSAEPPQDKHFSESRNSNVVWTANLESKTILRGVSCTKVLSNACIKNNSKRQSLSAWRLAMHF